ncbi:MAG: hypothetical protein AAF950_17730 [Pseudomonadota bacterium]
MSDLVYSDKYDQWRYSDEAMAEMTEKNYCEDCGAEVPSLSENGFGISFDGKRLCSDCCHLDGGYSIEGTSNQYADYNT